MPYRLAADIGGTFTDVVKLDVNDGICITAKVPTTLDNLAEGIVTGFDLVTEGDYSDVADIVHGTTNGLNALLERRGAKTALITTRGFRDVYEIGRGNHPEMYNVHYRKPAPLVDRRDVFEVSERIRADGSVERELAQDELAALAAAIDRHYEAVAICFINSFANPGHEQAARRILAELLTAAVTLTTSSEISTESREFERFSTAILNAYIAPAMNRYLSSLEQLLAQRGMGGPLRILNSNGGLMPAATAKTEPVRTLMSGPVGGVIGTAAVGAAIGARNLIALDMGGTSFDVSMLSRGAPDISLDTAVGGVPVVVPAVNTLSVGAGGGSLAWTEAGAMRVGPESSGSVPGPICYGRGGSNPTVTDANLVLGHIDPENFLGGRMQLDAAAPSAAFARYGREHQLSELEAAAGTLEIANSKMADAIREITLWRGQDVRDFILLAYGGAGPMHAALIADQLDVRRVVIPPEPGAFSAWGMLHADLKHDIAVPVLRALDGFAASDFELVSSTSEALLAERIAAEPGDGRRLAFSHSLDLRYIGQQYSLNLELDDPFDASAVRAAFESRYVERYGFSSATARVGILNLRTVATVLTEHKPTLVGVAEGEPAGNPRAMPAYFDGQRHEVPVHRRTDLPSNGVAGPALVVELTSTLVVPLGWQLEADPSGCLILTRP